MLNGSVKNITMDVLPDMSHTMSVKSSRNARHRADDRGAEFTERVSRIISEDRARNTSSPSRYHVAEIDNHKRGAETNKSHQNSRYSETDRPNRVATDRNQPQSKRMEAAAGRGESQKSLHDKNVNATVDENRAAIINDDNKSVKSVNTSPAVNAVKHETKSEQASELIGKALARITKMLNLPSEFSVDGQSLVKFDQDALEQFASILHALERIGVLLDKASEAGDGTALSKMGIESEEEAAILSTELRMQKFHIKMGLGMIGAREIVSDIMADKHGGALTGGISQAASPESLSMSAVDSASVFANIIEDDLAAAIEKVTQSTIVADEAVVDNASADKKSTVGAAISRPLNNDNTSVDEVSIDKSYADDLSADKASADKPVDKHIDKSAFAHAISKNTADVNKNSEAEARIPVDSQALRDMFKKTGGREHKYNKDSKNDHVITKTGTDNVVDLSVKSANLETVFVKPQVVSDDIEVPISITELAYGKEHKGHKNGSDIGQYNSGKESVSTMSTSTANVNPLNAAVTTNTEETQTFTAQIEQAQSKAADVIDNVQKTASAFNRADNEAVIRQIMDKMHGAIRNGGGAQEIRMILKPEALGEVRMSIRVEGDVVAARMVVESQQVKAIVESNMQSLKDSLEEQNLRTAELSVDVRSDSDKSNERGDDMIESSRVTKNRAGGGGVDGDGNMDDLVLTNGDGPDTGRRFGSNSFEYFV